MNETKYEMLWRILREERYNPLFAEKISDSYDQELAADEGGMREGIRETATILLDEEVSE